MHTQNANEKNGNEEDIKVNLSNGEMNSGEDTTQQSKGKCPLSNNKTQLEKEEEVKSNEGGATDGIKREQGSLEPLPLKLQPVVLPGGIVMPPPKVETVTNSWKSQHLTHDQVNDYCKKLFSFKTVNIMLFK